MKNMKKILLSLLLIPSIAIAGCGKDDDSKDTTTNQQQGSGNGSGSGSESGGSQTPAGLTQAEQDAAYLTLKGVSQNYLNKTNKNISITQTGEIKSEMTLGENDGVDPDTLALIEEMLGEETSYYEKYKSLLGYDLNSGISYMVDYIWNDAEEDWKIDIADYVVKDGSTYKYYKNRENQILSENEDETIYDENESFYVDDKYTEKMATERVLVDGFFDMFNQDNYASFKEYVVESLSEFGFDVNVDDATFELKLENNVYTLTAKIENFSGEDISIEEGMNIETATLNALIEVQYTNTKINAFKQEMSFGGPMSIEFMPGMNINFDAEMGMTAEAILGDFDVTILEQDFTNYGEITNIRPWITVNVNGIDLTSVNMLEFGDVVNSTIDVVFDSSLGDLAEVVGDYYLDSECTIPLTSLETIPSYDFTIYTNVDVNEILDDNAVVIIEHDNADHHMNADILLVNVDTFDINQHKLFGDGIEVDEILVNGVATTQEITLQEKTITTITIKYIEE